MTNATFTPTLFQLADHLEDLLTRMADYTKHASKTASSWERHADIDAMENTLEWIRTTEVAMWRAQGDSWPTIGRTLGVSHQAAHKKYAPLIAALVEDGHILPEE